MDTQLLLNISFGVIGVIAGWIFKVLYNQLRGLEEEINEVEDKHDADHRLITERISNLALSLPEKYVNKGDFDNLVKVVHHRFDRIEEKLDDMKNGK